jgi:hypothetical protein
LLVILGRTTFVSDEASNTSIGLTSTRDCFEPTKLQDLSIYQIAFWDEVHKEQVVGVGGDVTYVFPQDENGVYLQDGNVADQATKLHMKYMEQGRFWCGRAVRKKDGAAEGCHCVACDFTGRNVITIATDESMTKGGIAHVRGLTGAGGGWVGGWVVDNRCAGELWDGDNLKGRSGIEVGIVRSAVLFAHGVDSFGRLRNMTAEKKQEIITGGG